MGCCVECAHLFSFPFFQQVSVLPACWFASVCSPFKLVSKTFPPMPWCWEMGSRAIFSRWMSLCWESTSFLGVGVWVKGWVWYRGPPLSVSLTPPPTFLPSSMLWTNTKPLNIMPSRHGAMRLDIPASRMRRKGCTQSPIVLSISQSQLQQHCTDWNAALLPNSKWNLWLCSCQCGQVWFN